MRKSYLIAALLAAAGCKTSGKASSVKDTEALQSPSDASDAVGSDVKIELSKYRFLASDGQIELLVCDPKSLVGDQGSGVATDECGSVGKLVNSAFEAAATQANI